MWGSETQVTLHPLWSSALLGLCQAAVPALQLLLSPSDKTVPLFQFTKEQSMSHDSALPWAATRRPWPCTLMSPFLGKSKLFIFSYGKLFFYDPVIAPVWNVWTVGLQWVVLFGEIGGFAGPGPIWKKEAPEGELEGHALFWCQEDLSETSIHHPLLDLFHDLTMSLHESHLH